ncbi:TDP-N-acetylfucosamine:lipid II N-acetylfucosaminyltransferase [Vibrio sp. Isolate32]|uniref:TDP-N-acetylfucosamine:lipid II N-acetylfucosaminyltransferase n=1 Tax=Vibrio sp. Isolate32 TaxID=2908538 RepID=UPI001EFE96A4|nr:TDP-N-acetylfucosamine:lipid II N-acetylfucosaminyltransferase [Vibrio sp. Isolate32]MCG9553879.1 TDP-N-acetylfucosamine:lipid II N-acetylfucosaminyltransferase [Vibrio sp. Isolate32]
MKLNILHLTTDNKFFPMALRSFERVFPKQNTSWVKTNSADGNFEGQEFDRVLSFSDVLNPKLINEIEGYSCVVLHSFDPFWLPIITMLPKKNKIIWIGWGYDYYDLIDDENAFLLDTTKTINMTSKSRIDDIIRSFKSRIIKRWKSSVLYKINSLSTVIEDDYLMIRSKKNLKLPEYRPWNYGELYTDYVKGVIEQRVNSNKILIGNSASATNNHIEILEIINGVTKGKEVIIPLSYGNVDYRNRLKNNISKYKNLSISTLENFLPSEEYTKLLLSCGNVVMNHIRQQAVGNIVIALYLGAKVYLRTDNPVYGFLSKKGFVLFSIDELVNNPDMLDKPLEDEHVKTNQMKLEMIWSMDNIDKKTKDLILGIR